MFMKASAVTCQSRAEPASLLPELQPFLNREFIKDPDGFDFFLLNQWEEFTGIFDPSNVNPQSLKISISAPPGLDQSLRATFELTRSDLEKIKKRVITLWDDIGTGESEESFPSKPTFVVTFAYVSVCIVKARERTQNNNSKLVLGFTADCRSRLEPPIPDNYFGNCVSVHVVDVPLEEFTMENGLIIVSRKIYSKVKMLDKAVPEEMGSVIPLWVSIFSGEFDGIGVAGSTRFGVYRTDFGWGRPIKVEITSIDRGVSMALAESRDGNGGVEIGMVQNKNAMNVFATVFREGLESL
ncbi:hypothetical protein L6164_006710 [Bauhinia variegata]|uniref:Uncharacterized protein n=1 Tax=Bauhinia variegata TaxID=167791 RepID=A0ACB9Q0Q0_BAUVA|nr:hypothetical protein L6164_006710 [Bauhinia variegata]